MTRLPMDALQLACWAVDQAAELVTSAWNLTGKDGFEPCCCEAVEGVLTFVAPAHLVGDVLDRFPLGFVGCTWRVTLADTTHVQPAVSVDDPHHQTHPIIEARARARARHEAIS